jgi:hypothetical protein
LRPQARTKKILSYRSVLVLLKYGRDGAANMTTAMTNPASNEITSIIILPTHFARARLEIARASIFLLRLAMNAAAFDRPSRIYGRSVYAVGKPVGFKAPDRVLPVRVNAIRLREVREGENDVGQGQHCESRARQFAEQAVLCNTVRRNGLGLLLDLLKARESLIKCGSSHFPYPPVKSVTGGCRASSMPTTEPFILLDNLPRAQSE